MVAAPTVVYIEATLAAGTVTIPAVSTHTEPQVGDLCVITQTGNQTNANTPTLPAYTSGGADAGFTRDSGIQNVGTNNGKSNVYSKVLVSGDFSSSQLKQFTLDSAPYNGHRVAILIFRHANGFDSGRVFQHVEETASFAVNTAQTLTDCTHAAVVVQAAGWSTGGVTNPKAKWDGGTARFPYCDKGTWTVTVGGHLDRQDSTTTTTNGSPTVLDTSALATDVGAQLTIEANGIPAGARVISASAGVSLTFDANADTTAATILNLTKHYGFNLATQTSGVDYNEYQDSDTIASWSWSAGTNNTTHAFSVVTYQISGDFTRSATDNVGITDTRTQESAFIRSYDNALGITDSVQASLNGDILSALITDALGITDVVPRARTASATNNIGVTDVGSATISSPERVGITDNTAVVIDRARIITNTLTLPDNINTAIFPGTHDFVFNNAFGLMDNVDAFIGQHWTATINDHLGIEDTVGPTGLFHDTFGITDQIIVLVPTVFYFRPPTQDDVSNIAYEVPPSYNRLMRYYPPRPRGVAVWKLIDGTYTTDQPYPTNQNTPQTANAQFPVLVGSGLGTSFGTNLEATYDLVYLGGHVYPVDNAEAQRLIDAGFGAGVSTTPP